MNAAEVEEELAKVAEKSRIPDLQRFFKTAPGEYAAGDVFIGVRVPNQRRVAHKYKDLPLSEIKKLLHSKIHEHRLTGVFILYLHYRSAKTDAEKTKINKFYLDNRAGINNWDLVDSSAAYICGDYYLNRPRARIDKLVKSKNLWDRRIAVMTAGGYIKAGDFGDTFKYAKMLLNDKEDLIHKATGWMLREVGKRDKNAERIWLDKYYQKMPRTMLRYAIEKFTDQERKKYLSR